MSLSSTAGASRLIDEAVEVAEFLQHDRAHGNRSVSGEEVADHRGNFVGVRFEHEVPSTSAFQKLILCMMGRRASISR